MLDAFFDGVLDGCSGILGIAFGIALGAIIAGLLFQPLFWGFAGIVLVVWIASTVVKRSSDDLDSSDETPLSESADPDRSRSDRPEGYLYVRGSRRGRKPLPPR
jgi:hypothetical protein